MDEKTPIIPPDPMAAAELPIEDVDVSESERLTKKARDDVADGVEGQEPALDAAERAALRGHTV